MEPRIIIVNPGNRALPMAPRVPKLPPSAGAAPGDTVALEKNISKARDFFSRYGLGEAHGNGPVTAVLNPITAESPEGHFHNAGYVPQHDAMLVGHIENGPSFAKATDVIAHEYSHRVVDRMTKLMPLGESGVVHESLADTFAAAIDRKDWTIGEDVTPGGMRSMLNPEKSGPDVSSVARGSAALLGKLPRPAHMDDYVHTRLDNGGVHINVGIPNKAAALIGETLGRDRMADIYMEAVRGHLPVNPAGRMGAEQLNLTSIGGLAKATMDATSKLFPTDTKAHSAVRDAWKAVGVDEAVISSGLEKQRVLADALRARSAGLIVPRG